MDVFGTIVIVVCVVSAVIAVIAVLRAGEMYREIGRLGDLWLDTSEGLSQPTRDLVQEEVRQMLDAIEAARRRRDGGSLARDHSARQTNLSST